VQDADAVEGAGRRLSRAPARRDPAPVHGEAAFWSDNPHYLGAIERGDVIYTSAIVQQVVFALNREYFPGEKKLAEALETLPILPQRFAAVAKGLLFPNSRPGVEEMREQRRALASHVGEIRCLLTDFPD
jgi:hypothetical protein